MKINDYKNIAEQIKWLETKNQNYSEIIKFVISSCALMYNPKGNYINAFIGHGDNHLTIEPDDDFYEYAMEEVKRKWQGK